MSAHSVAPTKSNLLKVRERLRVATEGYELLEQKREILVMELMRTVDRVRLLERDLEARVKSAYPALKALLLGMGREAAFRLSAQIEASHELTRRGENLAGIAFTILEYRKGELAPSFSIDSSSANADLVYTEWRELLGILAQAASLRAIVWRLALEVKKTQRRVNALEKLVIPEAEGDSRYIEAALEEKDRDAFFASKLLKARREGRGH
jgi:V/A-type H+-transporting ATPase subunit D